jgi:hypothetical protein
MHVIFYHFFGVISIIKSYNMHVQDSLGIKVQDYPNNQYICLTFYFDLHNIQLQKKRLTQTSKILIRNYDENKFVVLNPTIYMLYLFFHTITCGNFYCMLKIVTTGLD